MYFSINISHFLINNGKEWRNSWNKPNKRHMEKGDIISLVGKNCPRDIHWGPVTRLQSRSCELEPMHSRISFIEIGYKIISTAIRSLPPICVGQFRLTLEYYECRCCNQYQSQQPKRAKIHISKFTLHSHDENYSDTYVRKCKYTFILGQTQVYNYTRANLLGYVFASTCALLHTGVKFTYM